MKYPGLNVLPGYMDGLGLIAIAVQKHPDEFQEHGSEFGRELLLFGVLSLRFSRSALMSESARKRSEHVFQHFFLDFRFNGLRVQPARCKGLANRRTDGVAGGDRSMEVCCALYGSRSINIFLLIPTQVLN